MKTVSFHTPRHETPFMPQRSDRSDWSDWFTDDDGAERAVGVADGDAAVDGVGEVEVAADPVKVDVLRVVDAERDDRLAGRAVEQRARHGGVVAARLGPEDEALGHVAGHAQNGAGHARLHRVVRRRAQVQPANVAARRHQQQRVRA